MEKIKIIIADDHPVFRGGLMKMIGNDNEIEIIAEAENGEKALNKIIELNPDIALLDIDMPKMTGIQILKELKNVPVDRLEDSYSIIHSLRANTKKSDRTNKKILSFAGSFGDMTEKDYNEFV